MSKTFHTLKLFVSIFSYRRPHTVVTCILYIYCDEKFRAFNFSYTNARTKISRTTVHCHCIIMLCNLLNAHVQKNNKPEKLGTMLHNICI